MNTESLLKPSYIITKKNLILNIDFSTRLINKWSTIGNDDPHALAELLRDISAGLSLIIFCKASAKFYYQEDKTSENNLLYTYYDDAFSACKQIMSSLMTVISSLKHEKHLNQYGT